MNIAMMLRLMMTPVTPIVKRIAESARYHESCGSILFVSVFMTDTKQSGCFVGRLSFHWRQIIRSRLWIDQGNRKLLRSRNHTSSRRQQPAATRQRHRTNDSHQQQYRGDLERQEISRKQLRSDRVCNPDV